VNIQLTRAIEWLLIPPGLTILLLLLVIKLWNSRQKQKNDHSGPVILWIVILSLYMMSINFTANQLTMILERPDLFPPLTIAQIKTSKAEAIIILGHGRYSKAPEYGGEDTLNTGGLARTRYGAKLHRETGLPILTAGGTAGQDTVSEAAIMKKVLENEFDVPVRWLEEKSKNTYENALFSSKILKKENIERVLMVTHSRDIIRALGAFQEIGILNVTPAPTLFAKQTDQTNLLDWLPNPYAISRTAVAIHEIAGMFWYRWRYGVSIPQNINR
jgi:uncharacterized SAM-binding protein YcdF (DUF218 family)